MANLPKDIQLERLRRRTRRIRALIFAIISAGGTLLFVIAFMLYRRVDPQGNFAPLFWGATVIVGLLTAALSTAFFDYSALFRRKP